MPKPSHISPRHLLSLIGTPECPVIADVSIEADYEADPYLIPGAFRHPHTDMAGLLARIEPQQRCVVVCQKGRKLSQGAAAWLRSEGRRATYLEGGNHGWRETAGAPRIPVCGLPQPDRGSLWVTGHRPNPDCLACAWLIRRFVDPQARVLFVSPAEVPDVADRFGAVQFGANGMGGSDPAGQGCFERMRAQFALHTDALDRLAGALSDAGAGPRDPGPRAAGLTAIFTGLRHRHPEDRDLLAAGEHIIDALYRWAQAETREGCAPPQGRAA